MHTAYFFIIYYKNIVGFKTFLSKYSFPKRTTFQSFNKPDKSVSNTTFNPLNV